jgi:hypothetical protein
LIERILVVAPHLGALTDYARTLDDLTARRCRVHIAVEGDAPPGTDLTPFTGKFHRLTIGAAPPPDKWLALGTALRSGRDRWHLERHLPSSPRVLDFLRAHEPDAVLVVTLFDSRSTMQGYLQAAAELGIATVGFPSHWDDLARGPILHRLPDCLALWNRVQRRQAVETRGIPARRTIVLGASLALDIVRKPQTLALAPDRRIIFCEPGPAPDLDRLTQWIESVRSDVDALVRDAHVLIHLAPPGGVEQSTYVLPGDVHVMPGADSDASRYAAQVAGALTAADVVVAWDTTMVFEAAARGKPVVALLWPDERDPALALVCAAEGVSRGWLTATRTLQEHTAAIRRVLTTPLTPAQRAAARSLVRPHGPDLLPGFLLSARALQEVVNRRAETPPAAPAPAWARRLLSPLATLALRRAERMTRRGDSRRLARVLVGVASAKSLFLHQPLLRVLAERGHHVTIVFTARARFPVELHDKIKCDVPGVSIAGVFPERSGAWAACVRVLLGVFSLGLLAHRFRSGRDVPPWLARYAQTVLPRRRVRWLMLRNHDTAQLLSHAARAVARLIPSSEAARQLVLDQRPDVVTILPDDEAVAAVESAGAQLDLIGAAESLGVPVIAAAGASELQVQPIAMSRARVMCVWGDEQRRAAIALGVPAKRIVVTGALPLDRALSEEPVVDEPTFREMLGLPMDRPFVFFAGSSGLMSEPAEEVELICAWVRSLRTSADPLLRQLAVLIRPSPLGISRWRQVENDIGGGVVVCPRTFERSGELDAVLLAESVRFAALTIGADPLTLLMAAGLGRPAALILPPRFAKGGDAIPLAYLTTTEGSTVRHTPTLADLSAYARQVITGAPPSLSGAFRRTHLRPPPDLRPAVVVADWIDHALRGPAADVIRLLRQRP